MMDKGFLRGRLSLMSQKMVGSLMQRRVKWGVMLLLSGLLLLPSVVALAHNPVFVQDNNHSWQSALLIPDHQVSWAIYARLAAPGEVDFFAFEGVAGESALIKMDVPLIEGLEAFQKAIMQWRPDNELVTLVNVFDDLHEFDLDDRLLETYQTPRQFARGWDGNVSFDIVIKQRQALLNARPALRRAYFASNNPLTFYGLPTSDVQDMGNHYAIRLQRAVLQEWKESVPWATVGTVTIANGGDIAKQLGVLPAEALLPE